MYTRVDMATVKAGAITVDRVTAVMAEQVAMEGRDAHDSQPTLERTRGVVFGKRRRESMSRDQVASIEFARSRAAQLRR